VDPKFGQFSVSAGPGDHVSILAAGRSDAGRVREVNEDAFVIDFDAGIFMVADGMGGHQGGAAAAAAAVKAIPSEIASQLRSFAQLDEESMCKAVGRAFASVSRQIFEQSSKIDAFRGMGATAVNVVINGRSAIIANMGDSRGYLLRDHVLERLTEDHSLVSLLLKMGEISKEQARAHPGKHVVTRYIGMEGGIQPDVAVLDLSVGDCILLCTDGLTRMVHDRRIAQILLESSSPEDTCARLVDTANAAGGSDNITVLVIQYGTSPAKQNVDTKVCVRKAVSKSLKRFEWAHEPDTEGEIKINGGVVATTG